MFLQPVKISVTTTKTLFSFFANSVTDSGGAEDLAGGKAEGDKLPGASEGSSPEEGQPLGRRKRKQTGQWWLSCERKEETETTNNPATVKKSRQHSTEPRAARPSPVKAKEDGHQSPIPAKDKKLKRNKNRPARGGTSEKKRKATRQIFNTNEAEERDEQQQQEEEAPPSPNQDMDPEQSSPSVFAHSDVSHISGKVNGGSAHCASNKVCYLLICSMYMFHFYRESGISKGIP